MSVTKGEVIALAKALGGAAAARTSVKTSIAAGGSVVSIPDGADGMKAQSLVVAFSPIQSGSGDPSPENIRPITGRTGLTAYRTGVNVWDEEWELGVYDSTTGQPSPSTFNIRSKNKIPVKPDTVYFAYIGDTLKRLKILYYKSDGSFISYEEKDDTTFTTPSNCTQIAFSTLNSYGATYLNDISINYPATETTYHAHTGNNSYPVSWQDSAGTVYGGTVDVVSGVLTVDRYYFKGGWTQYNSSNGFIAYKREGLPYGKSLADVNNKPMSNTIGKFGSFSSSAMTENIIQPPRSVSSIAYMALDENVSPDDVDLTYLIAEPQTIQLTPQTVRMLLGVNNVWASDGTIQSMDYTADTKLYIDSVAPHGDGIADSNITSGDFFMDGNQLYVATATIAAGDALVPGTNCTVMSIADALNALNS